MTRLDLHSLWTIGPYLEPGARADPSARALKTRLAGEYAASLERLLPLKAHLAATDRLIDRVVYRLYGLTEEEIGLVDGGRVAEA